MSDFHSPVLYVSQSQLWKDTISQVVLWFSSAFFWGKFFSLFSFLFGLGLSIQMERVESRNVPFVPLYLRRQFILLMIGLIHGVLFWFGDILAPYALYGSVLLFFRKRSLKTLLIWVTCLVVIPTAVSTTRFILNEESRQNGFAETPPLTMEQQNVVDEVVKIYSQGSFSDIMKQRSDELISTYHMWFGRHYGTTIFAMFLLGLYAGRRKILQDPLNHLNLIRTVWWIGLFFLIVNTGLSVAVRLIDSKTSYALHLIYYQCEKISRIAICLFYVSSITLLIRYDRWQRYFKFLAAPGRMALSNYLFQSILCTSIFNSYGFSLYGKISPTAGLLITIAVFSIQIVISNWFLTRYRFGPAEWLWKSLTYSKWQKMKAERD